MNPDPRHKLPKTLKAFGIPIITHQGIDEALKKLGLRRGSSGFSGKVMGGNVYVHRSILPWMKTTLFESLQPIIQKIPKGFVFNALCLNFKGQWVRFDEAPNFDDAPEPSPCRQLTYSVDSGAFLPERFSTTIWHHKWMWVHDDYRGFNVWESKYRSLRWKQIPNVNTRKIAYAHSPEWRRVLRILDKQR